VNSTKKKKQSSIKLALCMTSFVHCNIRRFSTLQNLVLSFSYCPLIHLEKLPNTSRRPEPTLRIVRGGLEIGHFFLNQTKPDHDHPLKLAIDPSVAFQRVQ